MGGVQVYATAIRCAKNEDLKEEWEKYHEQTQEHERIMRNVLEGFGLDPKKETPGRKIVRLKAETLVRAMEMALKEAPDGRADRGRGMRRRGGDEGSHELGAHGSVGREAHR